VKSGPFITATSARTGWETRPTADRPSITPMATKPNSSPGLVLQAIEEGQAQYFANDRLRKMAGAA